MTYTRKLQKIGKSLFVSLPKPWVEKTKLNRGDTVTIVEHPNGSVTLYSDVIKDILKQITLTIEAKEPIRSLRRRVTGAYVDGFDLIKLEAAGKLTNDQQDGIREITENLFGLEIVEPTSDLVTIQCLLSKELPVERMIQRIHRNTGSMFGETVSALEEGKPEVAKSVIKRMRDVKRLSLVVHRLLRGLLLFPTERTVDMKPIDSVDFLRVIDKITEISGGIRKIAESITTWEYPQSDYFLDKLVEICRRMMSLFDWSMQALMSKDISLANRVLDKNLQPDFDDLWNLLLEAEQKAEISAPAFSHMHRIIDNLKQIDVYSQEIAEIAIDRAEEVYDKE